MTTQAPDGKDPMSGFFDAERSQGATAAAQFGDGATAPPPSRCSGPAPWQETTSAMGEPPQPLPPRDGADDAVPSPPVVAALPRDGEQTDVVGSTVPMTEQEERVNEGLGLGELCPAVNVTGSLGTTEQPVETPAPHDDDGEQTDVVEFTVPTMTQEKERVNEGLDLDESRPAVAATCSPEAAEQPVEAALPRDGEQDVVVGSTVPTMALEEERVNQGLDLRESHPAVNTTSSPEGAEQPVEAALPCDGEQDVVVGSTVPTMTQEKERVNEGLDLDTEDSSEAVPPVETPAPHNDDGEQAAETVLPRDSEQTDVVESTVPTMAQEKVRVNEGLDLGESHPAVNATCSPKVAKQPVETLAPRDGDGGQDEAAMPSATAMAQEQGNLIDLMEQGEPQPALAAKVSPAVAEQPLETPTPHDGDIGGNDAARTTQPLRPLMTRKEMAEYLNVTEVTVTQLVRQGMPCIYLGLTRTGNRSCRMRFQLDKCMEWLERREN